MKSKKLTGTLLCVFLSVPAVRVMADSKAAPTPAQTPAAASSQAAPAPQDNKAKEKLQDNTFIEQAALNGFTEVELSKLAASKATDEKLKKYATAAVKDQTANNVKLQQVAAQTRLDLPKKLDENNIRMINELKALSGSEFDKTYINLMKKSQDTTVALFDNAAAEPTLNVELRVFANQTLPGLRTRQENTHSLIDSSDQLSQR